MSKRELKKKKEGGNRQRRKNVSPGRNKNRRKGAQRAANQRYEDCRQAVRHRKSARARQDSFQGWRTLKKNVCRKSTRGGQSTCRTVFANFLSVPGRDEVHLACLAWFPPSTVETATRFRFGLIEQTGTGAQVFGPRLGSQASGGTRYLTRDLLNRAS